jgi:dihydrofolate reductase
MWRVVDGARAGQGLVALSVADLDETWAELEQRTSFRTAWKRSAEGARRRCSTSTATPWRSFRCRPPRDRDLVTAPLRYSINVTLDGCCDHAAIPADEEIHRHAVENLSRADALLFGRVTYEMMEAAWRPQQPVATPEPEPAPAGARPGWMEPFARTIDGAKKYVVSSTLEQVDWNAELLRGDPAQAVEQCKRESRTGLLTGGLQLPLALTELGLIDEYEFVVHPRLAGHGPTLFSGLS